MVGWKPASPKSSCSSQSWGYRLVFYLCKLTNPRSLRKPETDNGEERPGGTYISSCVHDRLDLPFACLQRLHLDVPSDFVLQVRTETHKRAGHLHVLGASLARQSRTVNLICIQQVKDSHMQMQLQNYLKYLFPFSFLWCWG